MRPKQLPITLHAGDSSSLFVRIARAIADEIRRGTLRPGDALPGTRTLAASLAVHRSTVLSAYAELEAQGWIDSKRASGTYVASTLPEPIRRNERQCGGRKMVSGKTGFPVQPASVCNTRLPVLRKGDIALWGGLPDARLVPVELLARAYRRAAKQHGALLLGYTQFVMGHPTLRASIARLVATSRAIACDADNVMITRGSQMALDLLTRSLIRPADVVVVESLCYPSAVNVFRRAGADVVPVSVDAEGIDVEEIMALSRKRRVRLMYITPHHQYPTTVTLAASRRLALLELARKENIAIVEDDYDQEFHYDGRPVLPLASQDSNGNVIYVGTLAKMLAPGLRLAFVIAPGVLLQRMAEERLLVDRQGDGVLECSIAELLEDGDLQRHVNRARRIYHGRRDAFCETLDKELGGVLSYRRPAGGFAIWAKAARTLNLEAWQRRSAERGVFFQIGRQFTLDDSHVPVDRLGFAVANEAEGARALHELALSLPVRHRAGVR